MVAFQIITLPVEFNASSRAKEQLATLGLVTGSDANGFDGIEADVTPQIGQSPGSERMI